MRSLGGVQRTRDQGSAARIRGVGVAAVSMLGTHVIAVGGCAVPIALAERIGPRCAAAGGRHGGALTQPSRTPERKNTSS